MINQNSSMHVESFFDDESSTISHVIVDPISRECAVVDSVLGFDMYSASSNTDQADKIIAYIEANNLKNQWLLETHIHADHISAASYLKPKIGGKTAIGSGILKVLKHWVPVFDNSADTPLDAMQFDKTFESEESFNIGQLKVEIIATPGHTPACVTYHVQSKIEQVLFVGDTLFAPQRGTARVDFPDGDAETLYHSIQNLYMFPDETVVYLCHDYPEDGESLIIKTTIGEQKQSNVLLNKDTSLASFKSKRENRDKTLSVPKLIYPAIQTNMRLGEFGSKNNNNVQYLKIPINQYDQPVSNMKFNTINEDITVSPQISVSDIGKIVEKGFKSIICNRPDQESQDQVCFEDISIAAKAENLQAAHLPFSGGNLTKETINEFEQLLETLPKPIFAYCRSGTRCATIWAHVKLKKQPVSEVLQQTQQAGYQLKLKII